MSTGFVPSSVSTVCVTRQPWAAAKSRHFCPRLANERKVSVSTHRQALAALLFFYGKVLCTDLPGFRRSEDLGRRGACRWC
uniref:phage integrase N-terminal SAM-like domain-containing protein n=1 Tax=Enterobacter hormaechei TaxID=158836 RepID=UPI00388E3BDB